MPDCIKAAQNNEPIIIRNPHSVRPFQHVLEPLFAYLLVGTQKYDDIKHFNIGPSEEDCITTEELAKKFCKFWGKAEYVINSNNNAPHEAGLLLLNCNKIHEELGWNPTWNIDTAIKKVCEFHKSKNIVKTMDKQIEEYILSIKK